MLSEANSQTPHFDINSNSCIFSIVLLAVLGAAMFLLQPGYVQGLVEYTSLNEEQAGLIAASEMYGIAITAIAMYFLIDRLDWRLLCGIFVLFSLVGNLVSLGQEQFELLRIVRFITGLGSGGLISLTFSMMGHTLKIDRNMGLIVAAVLTWGAIGLFSLPPLFSAFGPNGFMVVLAVFSGIGLLVINKLPRFVPAHRSDHSDRIKLRSHKRWMLLAGVFIYNLAIGIVWVYLSLVGINAGISEQTVATVMTISQILGIGGALIAFFLEDRLGHQLPLLTSILLAAGGIALTLGSPTLALFAFGVCLFNLLWNVTQPYIVAMLAGRDDDNKLVSQGVAMQMIGYAAGPTIAAILVTGNGYSFVNFIAILLFLTSAAIISLSLVWIDKVSKN